MTWKKLQIKFNLSVIVSYVWFYKIQGGKRPVLPPSPPPSGRLFFYKYSNAYCTEGGHMSFRWSSPRGIIYLGTRRCRGKLKKKLFYFIKSIFRDRNVYSTRDVLTRKNKKKSIVRGLFPVRFLVYVSSRCAANFSRSCRYESKIDNIIIRRRSL